MRGEGNVVASLKLNGGDNRPTSLEDICSHVRITPYMRTILNQTMCCEIRSQKKDFLRCEEQISPLRVTLCCIMCVV